MQSKFDVLKSIANMYVYISELKKSICVHTYMQELYITRYGFSWILLDSSFYQLVLADIFKLDIFWIMFPLCVHRV